MIGTGRSPLQAPTFETHFFFQERCVATGVSENVGDFMPKQKNKRTFLWPT
jgi:hypothetical protein